MYHGLSVPGFPAHPHRGFETVTVVREGLLDHADSLGAAARYGEGDVQWLTAGSGIQHAEMFPLLKTGEENPLDLFQIWLNLPKKSKMVAPYFSMLWAEQIPVLSHRDQAGRETTVEVRAGQLGTARAPAPPPDSWAADPHNEVAIWSARMTPGAHFELPPAGEGIGRCLYFFAGSSLKVNGSKLRAPAGAVLQAQSPTQLENGAEQAQFLVLQGRPIDEPVAHQGPFVMNTQEELRRAFADYRSTGFGGWPWPDEAPVHGAEPARFARRESGEEERPQSG